MARPVKTTTELVDGRYYKVTERQRRFAEEFVLDRNPQKAAIRAGYSRAQSHTQGKKCLANPAVVQLIKQADDVATVARPPEIDPTHVLTLLAEMATADLGEAFNDDGTLKPITEIPPAIRRCISSIDVEELLEWDHEQKCKVFVGRMKRMRVWDKSKAINMLAQHLGMLAQKVDVSVTSNLAKELADAEARASRIIDTKGETVTDE